MENAKNYIEEARRKLQWNDAKKIYMKALKIYSDDIENSKKELASLYLEMAKSSLEAEVFEKITAGIPILKERSSTLDYLDEARKLYGELNFEDPRSFVFEMALVKIYYAKLCSHLIDDEKACISSEDADELFLKAKDALWDNPESESVETCKIELLIDYSLFCFQRLSDPEKSVKLINKAESILRKLGENFKGVKLERIAELSMTIADIKSLSQGEKLF